MAENYILEQQYWGQQYWGGLYWPFVADVTTYTGIIELTARSRPFTLDVYPRDFDLTVQDRPFTLKPEDR